MSVSDLVATICFPLTDLRRFRPNSPLRTTTPNWRLPRPGHDFVRGCGVIRERRNGGIPGWPGYKYFCKASHIVTLCGPQTRIFDHTFKRLLFDDVCTGNLSVGLVRYDPLPAESLVELLRLPVRVGKMTSSAPLATIGRSLADFLFRATTPHRAGQPANQLFVCDEAPLMVCELASPDGVECSELLGRRYSRVLDWHAVEVFHRRELVHGVGTTIWIIARKTATTRESAAYATRNLFCKHLRALLLRRHCARAALVNVMRAVGSVISGAEPTEDAQTRDVLCRFLLDTFARLSKQPEDRWSEDSLRTRGEEPPQLTPRSAEQLALATARAAESAASITDADLFMTAVSIMEERGFDPKIISRARRYLGETPIPVVATGSNADSPQRRLHSLLVNLFDTSELRRLLDLDFQDLSNHLPGSETNCAELSSSVIRIFKQHEGHFDALFDAIRRARPRRAAEIEEIWAMFPTNPPHVSREARLNSDD